MNLYREFILIFIKFSYTLFFTTSNGMKIITNKVKETQGFAVTFTKTLQGGEVLGLVGNLGAGKTAFVQGLAKGLGIKETVNSPTYILMKIYKAKGKIKNLIHIDAYRLNDFSELINIGINDYLNQPDTIIVIEWADRVKGVKKQKKYKEIDFSFGKKDDQRIITYQ
jgi:tRNA threonylcarbamoyladenosine biosynthesis protein TsaE